MTYDGYILILVELCVVDVVGSDGRYIVTPCEETGDSKGRIRDLPSEIQVPDRLAIMVVTNVLEKKSH